MKNSTRLILLGFAILFGMQSFVNHYMFRTSGQDLGIYIHALYDYAHFRVNRSTQLFFDGEPLVNNFGDHFDIIQFLYVPFYFIFGTYTLLVIQVASILFGAWGLYRLARFNGQSILASNILLIFYLSQWSIFSALSFDYHDNVVGIQFVPWCFLFVQQKKFLGAAIMTVLCLISKETTALWMVFFYPVMAILFWDKKQERIFALVSAVICAGYFLLITKYVMPSLIPGRQYFHMNYGIIDNSALGGLKLLLEDPKRIMAAFFLNTTDAGSANYIKSEFYAFFLIGGGFLLVRKPVFLIPAIPIIMMKVFNDSDGKWGVYLHYSIEAAILLGLCAVYTLKNLKSKPAIVTITFCAILSVAMTIYGFENRVLYWYDIAPASPIAKEHYQREFDVSEMHRILNEYRPPEEIAVSAHYSLIPHLAERRVIYQFPEVRDADYIFTMKNLPNATYPLRQEDYVPKLEEYYASKDWGVVKDDEYIVIFKRIK